jgi:dihydrofolate reductase
MRRLVVLSFISLDGVMQAPGRPDEDKSGGFAYGGWTVPYYDQFLGDLMNRQMSGPFDMLLGRTTYEIFASYWPDHNDPADVIGSGINRAKKYVASRSPQTFSWPDSFLLSGDVADAVGRLKAESGPDLQVHGSGNLIQTLMKHDLVDEFWLKTYPLTLGRGKRLFAEGTLPAAFELIDSSVSPRGVVIANYRRSGVVRTGSF